MMSSIDWSQVPDIARKRLSVLAAMIETDGLTITPRLRQEARAAITDIRNCTADDPEITRALGSVRCAGIVLAGVLSLGSDADLARQNCIEALRGLTDAFRAAARRTARATEPA